MQASSCLSRIVNKDLCMVMMELFDDNGLELPCLANIYLKSTRVKRLEKNNPKTERILTKAPRITCDALSQVVCHFS